tara:strand:- start:20876 stop:23758 length:2883 start_codon:yes stop_codon:yes gene_type:complete
LVQTEQFRHYDTENGLSNNIVYAIYQDHEGFMWIATENGLNRFDGYEFRKYFHNTEDDKTISSNIVRSIVEDKSGNLWIGTYNGLNLFNRETERFTRFLELPSANVNRLDFQQMIIDKKARIWFCTLETAGWFDTITKEFNFLPQINNPFSISLDKEDNLWANTFDGEVFRYEVEKDSLTKISSNISYSQLPIFWGNYSKKLWVHDSYDLSKVFKQWNKIPELPEDRLPLKLLEQSEENLIVASDYGLFSFSRNNAGLAKIDFGEKSSSLTNSIRSLFQDKNGGLWVGTLSGFFHFDPYRKQFSNIDFVDKASDVIMGLDQVDQQLFVNTFSRGLKSYDLSKKEISEIIFSKKQETGFYQTWDIEWVRESDFPVWLATNEGLFLYSQKFNELEKIVLDLDEEKFPVTFSIENTSENHLWVSSLTALYKLSKKTANIEQVIKTDGTITSSIQDVQSYKNTILVATEGEGLFIYDSEKSDSLVPLTRLIPESSMVLTLPIWDLFLDAENLIWIGTNQGLFKLDIDKSTLFPISLNALKNRVIFSIQEDEKGNLWMGTEKGLIRFNPIIEEILEFNKSDGVNNVEYNRRSVIKSKNGELFFGGVEGVTSFDPQKIKINPIIPDVHILEARVVTSDSMYIPIGFYEEEIDLPWNKNTLEFDFVGLSFTNPSLNKFRYKLEGHDPDWVNSEARLSRYVQLPHGEYTFKVQVSNNDGVWNTEGASLQINISPPFWKTWLFRVFVLTLALLILWAVYRYRVKQLLEIERVKLRIASDLHDEVGSGLSGIALTGDILQRQIEKGDVKPELIQRITKNSRVLASSLDAIVWLIDSKKETVGDLISKSLITAKDLIHTAKIEVIDTVPHKYQAKVLSSVQRRNLFLLIKEALNNIAKHSNATIATLDFKIIESNLLVIIKDNGKGFEEGSFVSGRGLGTMKHRAEELGAILTFESKEEGGTEILVSIKIP